MSERTLDCGTIKQLTKHMYHPQQVYWVVPNADTPIVTGGLMSLIPLSKPVTSNAANWREAQTWLREMAGMRLNRIESIMDGMTLILLTKLKPQFSARAKSRFETAACTLTPGSRMFDGLK